MTKKFRNSDPNYKYFNTVNRPHSPSPKRRNYQQKAKTKSDNTSRCTYVHPETGKRCRNKLSLYPEFCKMHTVLIYNVYIDKSQIRNAGNGLYAGPFGFKKGSIIGQYNFPWNEVKLKRLKQRCEKDDCWNYVFCEEGDDNNTKCWDGLDIRSTLMRNINDAYGSEFRNNSYFFIIKGNVYVIASRNIKPHSEIFVSYGQNYWK